MLTNASAFSPTQKLRCALTSSLLLALGVLLGDAGGWLVLVCLAPLIRALKRETSPIVGGAMTLLVGFFGILAVFYGVAFSYPLPTLLVVFTQSLWFFLPGALAVWLAPPRLALPLGFGLVFALCWVFVEFIAAQRILLGPYANGSIAIGYTQHATPLLWLAHLTGVNGVSLVVVIVNATLASALEVRLSLISRALRVAGVAAFVLTIAMAQIAGRVSPPARGFRVAVIQTSPSWEQDERSSEDILAFAALTREYVSLTRTRAKDADLVVWPESALRTYLDDPERRAIIKAELHGLPRVLFGIFTRSAEGQFNSLSLSEGKGELRDVYDKRFLVGFFENSLKAGARSPVVGVGGVRLGLGICWESTFSDVVADLVRNKAEVLVFPTSNIFAGSSTLPALHQYVNIFRAAETGRYVVSASKGGPSAIIAPDGSVLQSSEMGKKSVVTALVSPNTYITFYVHLGNWVGISTTMFVLILFLLKSARQPLSSSL